jgi:hypothetical protein
MKRNAERAHKASLSNAAHKASRSDATILLPSNNPARAREQGVSNAALPIMVEHVNALANGAAPARRETPSPKPRFAQSSRSISADFQCAFAEVGVIRSSPSSKAVPKRFWCEENKKLSS